MAETNAIEIIDNTQEEPAQVADTEAVDTETQADADAQSDEQQPDREAENKPFTVKVKFLGKEMDIDPTTDESIALYQKGLNYDHMAEKLKNNPDSKVIAALAKKNGMTAEAYRKFITENYREATVRSTAERLREEYPDAPDDLLRRLAEAEQSGEDADAPDETDVRWDAFLEEFPEIARAEDLPDAVRSEMEKGIDPMIAMYRYKLQEARNEAQEAEKAAKIAKQNAENRNSSTGSMKAAAGSAQPDPEKMDYAAYKAWRKSQRT